MDIMEEIIFSSGDEEERSFEIVNEHNEFIGRLVGNLPALNADDSEVSIVQKSPVNSNESNVNSQQNEQIENESETVNSEQGGEIEGESETVNSEQDKEIEDANVSDNESSYSSDHDDDFYIDDSSDTETNERHNVTVPSVNYSRDVENNDDFVDGWCWHEVDPGCGIHPFTRSRSLQLGESERNPEHFFEALFDDSMWKIIADETNRYAKQSREKRYGMYNNKLQVH